MDADSSDAAPHCSGAEATSVTMSMMRAQVVSVVLVVPFAALSVIPHGYFWGLPDEHLFPLSVLGAFFGSIIIHEALHGIGYYWAGADRSDIEFGFNWSSLAPYAHCTVPLRANPYRVAVALPGLVLGVLPLGVGLGLGLWWLTVYAFLMLTAAAGDALLLWIMRAVPGPAWTQDHPSKMGCLVLGHASASQPPPVVSDVETVPPSAPLDNTTEA